MFHAIEANARLQLITREGSLAYPEYADIPGVHRRHEGFFTDNGKAPVTGLYASHAFPSRHGFVGRLRARFPGIVLERGAHLSGRFQFVMGVIVDAEPQVQAGDTRERVGERRFEIHPGLVQVAHRVALFAVILFLVILLVFRVMLFFILTVMFFFVLVVAVRFVPVRVSGYPVFDGKLAHGDADKETLANHGKSGGSALHLEAAGGQYTEDLLLFVFVMFFLLILVVPLFLFFVFVLLLLARALSRGLREARNLVVVSLSGEPVQMPAEHPGTPIQAERTIPSLAVVCRLEVEPAADSRERVMRYPSRVHVDHSADRARAVQQRAGALEDLHLVRDERVDGHRVLGAGDGDVQRIDAVFHDSNARAVESMDHRPAEDSPERGVVDSRLIADRSAYVVSRLAVQFLSCQHVGGLGEAFCRQRVPQNDDLLDRPRLFFLPGSFPGQTRPSQAKTP